jgi:hypothetical protein
MPGKMIMIDPRLRRRFALWIVIVSLIAWPISALTVARHEPQFVLGLSWFAITLTAVDVLSTSDVRVEVEDDKSEDEAE